MPKIAYREHRFRAESLLTIQRCNTIIADYIRQGFDLSLRQLYYQFVSEIGFRTHRNRMTTSVISCPMHGWQDELIGIQSATAHETLPHPTHPAHRTSG